MPIYAYRCSACGHSQDVLQKLSDPRLTICPSCGAEAFSKQVTAAGFQLKGSGWYVTDFRGNGQGQKPVAGDAAAKPEGGESKGGESNAGESKSSEAGSGDTKSAAADSKSSDSKPSGGGTTPASTPSAGT